MDRVKSSITLKIVSYIMMPILVFIILINTFSLMYYTEYQEEISKEITYFETHRFSDRYLNAIFKAINIVENITEENDLVIDTQVEFLEEELSSDTTTEEVKTKTDLKIGTDNIKEYNFGTNMCDIVLVYPNGKIFTNISKTTKTDSLEELIQYVKNKNYTWIYEENQIQTHIEKLKMDQLAYDYRFERIEDTNCRIYACIRNIEDSEFYAFNLVYGLISNTYQNAPFTITISLMFLIIFIIYTILSIGHKKGEEGIYTSSLDAIPFEIVGSITGIVLFIETFVFYIVTKSVATILSSTLINTFIMLIILFGISLYITITIFLVTMIRRIKNRVFWKNTIVYQVIKWLKKNTIDLIFTNSNTTIRLAGIFGGFIIIQIILMLLGAENFLFYIALVAFWYFTFKNLLIRKNNFYKIRGKIKDMYHGEVTQDLKEEEFTNEHKEIAKELNDISGGLSNAIEEAMKSERLKTELITNVSHDIKTPLTSIINYVDLMKKEKIENEIVKEYLEVLDNKSQRLKKLTEDLVEASKASSGNIKLNMEKLNLKQLIKQVRGEFEDKFEQRGLEIIENLPEEEIYIEADSRYLFRVMENMYVNVSKYALENSRVYVDVEKKENTARIILKNISQDKLNISVEELMQRFVRGDSARSTEGSGLGISIAKSLTELQKGKFDIYLDGDLFKVVVEFTLE